MMIKRREFNELSADEKAALVTLHAAGSAMRPITSNGMCDLVRKLTGNPKLKHDDDAVMVYKDLRAAGWIVVKHFDQTARTFYFGVSDEYRELQPA